MLTRLEILFRGKKLDYGKLAGQFVYGGYTEWGNSQSVITENGKYGENHAHEVYPNTVGQYVNKDDINGTKIFEGDIVKTKYGRLCVVVRFYSDCFNGFDFKPINTNENFQKSEPNSFDLWVSQNLEVIGNIYDNPELLED